MIKIQGNDVHIGDKSVREILKNAAEEAGKVFGTSPLYFQLRRDTQGRFIVVPEDALYNRTDKFENHEKGKAVAGSFAYTVQRLHDACVEAGIEASEEVRSSTYRPNRVNVDGQTKTIYESRWGIVFPSLMNAGGVVNNEVDIKAQLAKATETYFSLGGEQVPGEAIMASAPSALGWFNSRIAALKAEAETGEDTSEADDEEPAF